MPSRQPQAGSTLIWLFLWIVGTAAIAYWCATRHVPAVQQQIQVNAEAAVSSVAARDVSASVHGRTVTLKGSVADESQKTELLSALDAADGVRHINVDQLSVIGSVAAATLPSGSTDEQPLLEPTSAEVLSPESPTPEAPSNNATPSQSGTSTDSPLPEAPIADESTPVMAEESPPQPPSPESPSPEPASAQALSPASPSPEATPPEAPSLEIPTPKLASADAVSPGSPTPVTPSAEPSLPATPESPSPQAPSPQAPSPEAPSPASPTAGTSDNLVNPAVNDNVQQSVGELAEMAIANGAASSNVTDAPSPASEETSQAIKDVLEGDSSTFSMQITEDTLTLTGEISPEDDTLVFIQSAMRTFDVNYLVNSMQVSEENAKADWLPALSEFIPNLQSISDANVDISESQITLSGIAPDKQTHDKIIDAALSQLSELSLVDRIILESDIRESDQRESDKPNPATASAAEPEVAPTTGPADVTPQDTAQNNAQTDSTQPAAAQPSADSAVTSAAELSTLREAFKALEAEKILFQSGSDVLTEESIQTISAMSALLAEYTDINIEIDGHTDSAGSSEDNLQLSQLRANAVRDLMIERGIARERLSAYGFGDGVPIADNSTAAGRKLNRRIEFNF